MAIADDTRITPKRQRRSRSPMLLPKPTGEKRVRFLPPTNDIYLNQLLAPLIPQEKRALHEIADRADILDVDGERYLLVPVSDKLLDLLAEVGADGEDREPYMEDEPQPDDEPDDDDRCVASDDEIRGENDWKPGDADDREPSLGAVNELTNQERWASGHFAGGDQMDLEDEHDGSEIDDEDRCCAGDDRIEGERDGAPGDPEDARSDEALL